LVDQRPIVGDSSATEPRARWRLGELAIVASFVVLPLPNAFGLLALGLVVVAIVAGSFRNPYRILEPFPAVCLILCLWLVVLLVKTSVPSMTTGLLGLRLSIVFVLGAVLGYVWPADRADPFRTIWYSLLLASAVSIVIFLAFPGVEAGISRAANEYTSEFSGSARLQGIWPSPAHASLAAVFLILSSVRATTVVPNRTVRLAGLVVGLVALYLTQVRIGIVAVVVGLVLIAVTSNTWSARYSRALAIGVAGAIGIVVLPLVQQRLEVAYPAIASLANPFSDSRFLNRTSTWDAGVSMFWSSPFTGWGPGSAGSTLGSNYMYGQHVTPHNILLKYAVEGGVVALLLIAAILVRSAVAVLQTRDYAKVGLAVIVPVFVAGLIGTVVEAIPVSFAFAVILGRYVAASREIRAARKMGVAP
jgi:hypothetical protein